jgi:branched-subunit amino acid transport protein
MNIYIYIGVMAVTTYLVRALPLTLFKKPIRNRFLKSFLHYVPAACLTTMTFPAILYAGENVVSGAVGLLIGVGLSLKKKSLIVVAVASCAAVFLTEQLIKLLVF